MKNVLVCILLGFAFLANAQTSTKISDVHLCCQGCTKGVEKAVANVKEVTASVDQDAGTVTLAGPDKAAVQKAANALVAAGYFGKSSNDEIKLSTDSGAKGKKVQTLKLEGVHLCCGKCVSAADKAMKSVSGVREHTAKKNAESFEVTGDFNDSEVLKALQNAGLNARVAR